MQRLNDERGAVAVLVALLMVPLLGFAAIAIDVAAMRSEQQQLQSGADAGALAVAADCARGTCGTPAQTAQTLAAANTNDGKGTATVTSLSAGAVTVQNTATQKHWFAPILGFNQSQITAKASVAWGSPGSGTAVLPLTFSYCEFLGQTGGGMPSGTTTRTIFFTKSSGVTGCTGPSGNAVPGGFAWLTVNSGTCHTTSTINQTLTSSTGASIPTGCTPIDLQAQQNKTVLLPLYDQSGDTGAAAWYHIYGYAAFTLTGYNFPSKAYTWNAAGCLSPSVNCIKGYFARFVDLTEAFQLSTTAPQLGGAIVSLTA